MVGDGNPVFVIAEIGINHNGSVDLAKKLIDGAVLAGCDAVKFQKREPELAVPRDQWDFMRDTPWGRMRYIDYKHRIELRQDAFEQIDRHFEQIDKRFDQVDRQFEEVHRKFEDVYRKFAEIDRKFEQIAECFREMRRQFARLTEDFSSLARELSELRGEMRGRLEERAHPAPAG